MWDESKNIRLIKARVTRAILTPNITITRHFDKMNFFVKILVLHFKTGSNNHELRFFNSHGDKKYWTKIN